MFEYVVVPVFLLSVFLGLEGLLWRFLWLAIVFCIWQAVGSHVAVPFAGALSVLIYLRARMATPETAEFSR